MPEPIVLATSVPSIAPTRFMIAAIIKATFGVHALVDTDVAIALAASWKPFVKSNPNARIMTVLTRIKVVSNYDSLIATSSIMFAKCSNESTARSVSSSMSLYLISSIGSFTQSNSSDSVRR